MVKGIQTILRNIGDFGCGFLCILHQLGYAESEIIRAYKIGVESGALSDDCFVWSWQKLLEVLDPEEHKWAAEISTQLKPCTFYLEYWYNPRTKFHHFKLPQWDSLETSITVRDGYIKSYRLFTIVK